MGGISSTIRTLPAARTADQVLADIVQMRLPTGWAWNGDPTSRLGLYFQPLADMIATIEQTSNAQLQEVDPRTSVELLGNYEAVLGPDPAGRDLVAQTQLQQQTMVFQRWTAGGGQSIAYYESIGTLLGVPVSISDCPVISVCGAVVCGPQTPCMSHTERFTWVVTVPESNPASAGAAAMIELYAPAHTVVVLDYD